MQYILKIKNQMLKNSYCEKRQEEMPWALVTGDSYLYIENNDIYGYYFSNYSVPFVKNEIFNDTAMIVPDQLNSDEINSLGQIIGYLGKDVVYNNGDFKVVRNSNVTDSDKKKNIIIYGTAKTNNLISTINDQLWFKYDESGNIKTYKMKKETSKSVYEKLEDLDENAKVVLIIVGLFVIFAASATALYFLKNKKK